MAPAMLGRACQARSTPRRAYKPRLRDDVEIKIFRLKWGNDYAMVANPTDLVHYQVSVEDAEALALHGRDAEPSRRSSSNGSKDRATSSSMSSPSS